MSEPLTPEREAEIAARAAAATKGPWTVELEQCDCSDGLCSHGTYVSAVYADGERRTEFADFTDSDWQFVIRARGAVPELLAELDRVRAERDQYATQLDGLHLAQWEDKQDTPAEQTAEIDRLRQDNRAVHASERTLQQQIDAQAKEIDRLRTQLAQTVEHRDHWHAELMCADARILELHRQIPKGGA